MEKTKSYVTMFVLIKKAIPNRQYITFILILFKMIPLIIITHDWNISYPKGISRFLTKISFIELVHSSDTNQIVEIFILIIFFITLICLAIFFKLWCQIKSFGSLMYEKLFKIICLIFYWIHFFFNQHIFMLIGHEYLCEGTLEPNVSYKLVIAYSDNCRTISNIAIIVLQSILFLLIFLISFGICIIISEPFSHTSSLITTPLKGMNLELIIFPLFQGIIAMQFHIPFKVSIVIKGIIRGIYILFYLKYLYKEPKMFYSNEYMSKFTNLVYSMSFVSCLIEYVFLFDLNRNLIYLQENWTIIFFKLLFELTVAVLILLIKSESEKTKITNIMKEIICESMPYELLNKLFFILSRVEKVIGQDLLYCVIETFSIHFNEHKAKMKCQRMNGLKCYCTRYTNEDLISQSDDFLSKVNALRTNTLMQKKKLLKSTFPLLYKYIEYTIRANIIREKGKNKHSNFLLALVLFYNIFDNNYNKSLFYLEEFINTNYYKNSKIIQFQAKLINIQLYNDYTINLIIEPEKIAIIQTKAIPSENSFIGMYKVYHLLTQQIQIENQLSKVIRIFLIAINYFNENECSYDSFLEKLHTLSELLEQMNQTLIYHSHNSLNTNYHLCSKLTLYYSFFHHEIPLKIKSCFRSVFDFDCKSDNYSKLMINIYNSKDSWKFAIQYASDDFCNKIGYKLPELKGKEFNELFPKSLKKCFEYMILRKIRMGSVQLIMREMVIIDKEQYAILFDMIGIVIFTTEGLKLFLKSYAYDFKKEKKKKKKMKPNERGKTPKVNQKSRAITGDECFVLVNSIGKVIAISRVFEKYFSLSLNLIKKFKINVFKDILKFENTNNRQVIKKSLIQIYENIAELNFTLMQNTSNDDFAHTYKNIKEIQRKIMAQKKNINVVCSFEEKELLKTEQQIKTYSYITFAIELDNQSTTSFDQFLGQDITLYPLSISQKRITQCNFIKANMINRKSNQFQMNKLPSDVEIRFSQIQMLSLKYLQANYNIKGKDIFGFTQKEEQDFVLLAKEIETESLPSATNSSLPSYSTTHSMINSVHINTFAITNNVIVNMTRHMRLKGRDKQSYQSLQKESLHLRIRKKLFILLFIWILFSIIFLVFQSSIMLFTEANERKIYKMQEILFLSLITRHLFYGLVSSILRIQNCENKLHSEELIDNDFNNTIAYHKINIAQRSKDYLNYFKELEMKQNSFYYYKKMEFIALFQELHDYVSILKMDSLTQYSLNDFLSLLHLSMQHLSILSIPIVFNSSYVNITDKKDKDLTSNIMFIIENAFLPVKYVWDEGDNWILSDICKDSTNLKKVIYIIDFSNGLLLFFLFLIQSFIYNKINNQLYAKYYINYNYIQFFNDLLNKKVSMIKEFIDNSDIENFGKMNLNKISFSDPLEDSLTFKDNFMRIANQLPLVIKPYKIKEIMITEINQQKNNDEPSFSFIEGTMIAPNPFDENHLTKLIRDKELNSSKKPSTKLTSKRLMPTSSAMLRRKSIRASTNYSEKTNNSSIIPITQPKGNLLFKYDNKLRSKNQLKKPKSFLWNLIAFAFTSLSIIIFCAIDGFILNSDVNFSASYAYLSKSVLEENNKAQEIGLIYNIILLKNKKLEYEYKSHGYLGDYTGGEYLNNQSLHDVLSEAIKRFFYLQSDIPKLAQQISLSTFSEFLFKMDSPEACEYYLDFYSKNNKANIYNEMTAFVNFENKKQQYKDECSKIGFGINEKGIKTAKNSLVSSINSFYKDFNEDQLKTQESMLKRMNDNVFITYLVEIDQVFDKLFINYILVSRVGFIAEDNHNNFFSYIFFIVIIVLVVVIDVFYVFKFTYKFQIQNKIIHELESSIYNTIMF